MDDCGMYYIESEFSSDAAQTQVPVVLNDEINPEGHKFIYGNLDFQSDLHSGLDRSSAMTIIKPLVFLVNFENLPSGMPSHEYTKEERLRATAKIKPILRYFI